MIISSYKLKRKPLATATAIVGIEQTDPSATQHANVRMRNDRRCGRLTCRWPDERESAFGVAADSWTTDNEIANGIERSRRLLDPSLMDAMHLDGSKAGVSM